MSTTTIFRHGVEFSQSFKPRTSISHVLFDFDGTLSLVRQGWPEVMIPMFLEFLPRREGESELQARHRADNPQVSHFTITLLPNL